MKAKKRKSNNLNKSVNGSNKKSKIEDVKLDSSDSERSENDGPIAKTGDKDNGSPDVAELSGKKFKNIYIYIRNRMSKVTLHVTLR